MQQYSLAELEEIYREQRIVLKKLESKYDFAMAVMKAAPYFLISLITISVTLSLYAPEMFFVPLVVLSFIIILMVLLYIFVNRFDDTITLTQFELDKIKEGMDFRQKFLISSFVTYHQAMAALPSKIEDIDPNRYAREAMTINVRGMFGPMRVEDMEYRHPNIFRSMLQFESAYESFRDSMVSLSFQIKEFNSRLESFLGDKLMDENIAEDERAVIKEFVDIQTHERARIILNHSMGNHDYYSQIPYNRFNYILDSLESELLERMENINRKGDSLLPYFRQFESYHSSLSSDLVYRFGTLENA